MPSAIPLSASPAPCTAFIPSAAAFLFQPNKLKGFFVCSLPTAANAVPTPDIVAERALKNPEFGLLASINS